jgi:hypothetical protein
VAAEVAAVDKGSRAHRLAQQLQASWPPRSHGPFGIGSAVARTWWRAGGSRWTNLLSRCKVTAYGDLQLLVAQ